MAKEPSALASISSPPKVTFVALPFVVKPVPIISEVIDSFTYLVFTSVTVGFTRSIVKLFDVVSFPAISTILTAPLATSSPVEPIVRVISASAYVAVTPNSVNVLAPIVTTGSPVTPVKLKLLAPLAILTVLNPVSGPPTAISSPAAFLMDVIVT